MPERSTMMPPNSATEPPTSPVPWPRGVTGIRFAEAYFMIAETSSADIAFTSASGRLNVPDSSSWQ